MTNTCLSVTASHHKLINGWIFFFIQFEMFVCGAEATDTLTTSFCKFQKLKEQLRKLEERTAKMKVSLSVSCWSHVVSQMWTWKYIPQQNIN